MIAIAAATPSGIIAIDGKIPWKYKADLRRFKSLTWGKIVIMGGKTYREIGRPLGGRINIVISRKIPPHSNGMLNFVGNFADALKIASMVGDREMNNVYVIGGAEIYQTFMPFCREIDLTEVPEVQVQPGQLVTKLPPIPLKEFSHHPLYDEETGQTLTIRRFGEHTPWMLNYEEELNKDVVDYIMRDRNDE